MRQFYTRKNIIIGLLFFIFLVGVFLFYAYRQITKSVKETNTVNLTLKSLRSLEDVMDDMQDIETGQRGYVISGNRQFLEPYDLALQRIKKDTHTLKTIYSAYPTRDKQLLRLLELVNKKADNSRLVVSVLDRHGPDSAYLHILSGKGRNLMDSIRSIIYSLENEDRAVLEKANTNRQVAARASARFLIILIIALVIGLFILFWRLYRGNKLKSQYEKRIVYLAGLVEKTSDAIFSMDKNGVIITWNKGAEEIYGFTKEEAIGKFAPDVTRSGNTQEYIRQVAEKIPMKGSLSIEALNYHKDGRAIHCLASVTTLTDAQNNITGYLTVLRDITERKNAEKVLEKFNDELSIQVQQKTAEIQDIFERVSDGFVSLDSNWRYTYVNKKAQQMLNRTAASLIGKNIWEEFPDFVVDKFRSTYFLAMESQQYQSLEEYYAPFDLWLENRIYPSPTGLSIYFKDVTERKKADELLKRSNERFEMISRTTNDAVWEWDLENGEMWVNDTHQQLYGRTMNDKVPTEKEWQERIHPEDRDVLINKQAEALASNTNIFITEYRFKTTDDGYRNIYDRCYIIRNEAGKAIRMLGSMMDITERKLAEDEVRRSEETRKLIMNSALDAIVCIDLYGNILVWTPQSEKIFGWSESEVMGSKLSEIIIPQRYRLLHEEGMKRYLKTGEGQVLNKLIEVMAINNKGEEFPVELTIVPIQQGESAFFCAFIRDITKRKEAEEQIRREKELSDTAINSLPGIFYMLDEKRRFLRWNKNFETVSGYTPEEILSIEPVSFFAPEDRALARNKVGDIFSKGAAEMEAHFFTKNGQRIPYFFTGLAVQYEGKPCMLGTGIDISELKRAQEEIVKTNARFHIMSKATSDIVWDLNIGEDLLWWNDNYYSSLGYKKERELVQLDNWYNQIHPDDRQGVKQRFENAINGNGTNWRDEYRYRNAEGIYLNFLDRGFVMRDEKGKAYRMIGSIVDMTPIYTAQRIVAESENRLRTIINSEPQCIKLLDKNGLLLDMNPAGLAMIEADNVDQVKGHTVLGIIDEEYKQLFHQLTEQVFEGQTGVLLFSITGLKGTKRWLETHAVPMRNPEGEIIALLGVTADVTDKKHAEEELKKNEEKYRTLVEQAIDAIALYDAQGNILDANTGSVNLLGYSKEELMKMRLPDILTPEEIQEKPVRYDVLEKGESTIKKRSMRKKDGSIILTEVRSQQLPDGRFLSVIRDLTERITAEQQIEEGKKISDKLIDSLPGVFYWYDDTGKFLRWNKQFENVTGYSGEEISIMHPTDFFDGEGREHIIERVGKVFEEGSANAEADFISKDGSRRPYYFKAVRIDYDNKPCLLGTGIDVSERKKAEKELKDSFEAIRQLSEHLQNIREEERHHIAREIHDELGQQLTVLKMDISWLNKKIASEDPKVRARLNELVDMVDNTVKSVRKISSELRPSMLDDLGLQAALEWQAQEFGKRSGIKISLVSETGELKLPGNIGITLFRIFQESLTNVARHAAATEVKVFFQKVNGRIELTIRDNGKGFVTTGIENKRTLGILGMRERVSIINGEYSIDSIPGKGTTVKVSIPFVSVEE